MFKLKYSKEKKKKACGGLAEAVTVLSSPKRGTRLRPDVQNNLCSDWNLE